MNSQTGININVFKSGFHCQAAVLQWSCSKQWTAFIYLFADPFTARSSDWKTCVMLVGTGTSSILCEDNFCFAASVICPLKTFKTTTAFCVSASFSSALFSTWNELITPSFQSFLFIWPTLKISKSLWDLKATWLQCCGYSTIYDLQRQNSSESETTNVKLMFLYVG